MRRETRIKICIAVIAPSSLREIVRACPRIYCEIRNVTFRGRRRSVTIDAPRRVVGASGNAAGLIDRSREARAASEEARREKRKERTKARCKMKGRREKRGHGLINTHDRTVDRSRERSRRPEVTDRRK